MDFKKRAKGAVVVVGVVGLLVRLALVGYGWLPKSAGNLGITTTSLSLLHTEADMWVNKVDQMSLELYQHTTC